MTHLCTRTAHISNAGEDLAALNTFGVVDPDGSEAPPGNGLQILTSSFAPLIVSALGVTVVLIVAARKYR